MTCRDTLPFDKLLLTKPEKINSRFYPSDHPINQIKDLVSDLFGHHDVDKVPNITKRRKLLRRVERKLNSLENETSPEWQTLGNQDAMENDLASSSTSGITTPQPDKKVGSLWDLKEKPELKTKPKCTRVFGPKTQTLYTVKNNKIVRLEPTDDNRNFRTSDLVVPTNKAEKIVLEGKKLGLEDIRSLPKFGDYSPGSLSKVLFLKNISNGVTADDLQKLFRGINLEPQIRLMSGRMRGQAFATFPNEKHAADALKNLNGVIFKGKPLILQYGRGETERNK